MSNIKLEKLSEHFNKKMLSDNVKHIMVNDPLSQDDWVNQGRPVVWLLVETVDNYSVYADAAYGWLSLFENDTLVGCGKDHIIDHDVIVLCRGYYSTNKYIWK